MVAVLALLLFVPQVGAWETAVNKHPNAANYRNLARAYEQSGLYTKASNAYDHAAEKYSALGDPNAARVLRDLANRYRTVIKIYADRPLSGHTLARNEPPVGCYLGANVEREDEARDPESFNQAVGKNHALFFIYQRYGGAFPMDLAQSLRRIHAGLQIAWEPDSLAEVRDDRYLRGWVRDATRSGIPVFVRFASEMNGDWTPYHNDPAAYRATFRLVNQVVHQGGNNVATVWCPNVIPEHEIDAYYPGKDGTDWVGVNFYSVIFNDADRARGAEWRHPADALDYVYHKYAADHPMMVGEWAASHLSVVDNVQRPDFAANKIGQFYAALPRLYPRVKAVHWLSMNTIVHASPGRRLNDYSLLDNGDVAKAYRKAILPDYFLSRVDAQRSVVGPAPIVPGEQLSGNLVLSAFVRSYDQTPKVIYTVGSKRYEGGTVPGGYELRVPASDLPKGKQQILVEVVDSHGALAGKQGISVDIR